MTNRQNRSNDHKDLTTINFQPLPDSPDKIYGYEQTRVDPISTPGLSAFQLINTYGQRGVIHIRAYNLNPFYNIQNKYNIRTGSTDYLISYSRRGRFVTPGFSYSFGKGM